MAEMNVSPEYLGAEFLTFLWHAGESGEELQVGEHVVRVSVGQHLKLRSMDGSGSDVVIKGEHAHRAPELFVALWRGAMVVQAKVQLDINGTVLSGALKSDNLTFNGVKLPKVEEQDAGPRVEKGEKPGENAEIDRQALADEAAIIDRSAMLELAQGVVDAWFEQFLKERNSRKHQAWVAAVRKWVAGSIQGMVDGKLPS
ncbi:MAG: hypothetical protein AB2A00_23205 [Myxococcota bacterium]